MNIPALRVATAIAVSVTLAACADAPDQAVTAPDAAPALGKGAEMSLKEGALYVAELHPLNASVQQRLDTDKSSPHGVAHGTAYFRVVNGELRATVDMSGVEPNVGGAFPEGLHAQHIHAADRCPSMSADVNGDGIVDVIEGVPFYGPILVPLDGNIENNTSEIPTFPTAFGSKGTYLYEQMGSLNTLEITLGEALRLPTRHVVVHGVDLATPLPASVASLGGLPAQITLPVACGPIRQVR